MSKKNKHRSNFKRTNNPELLNIVICVHNAYQDVKNCLESIFENTTEDFGLIIVNDGSDKETSELLSDYDKKYSKVKIIHNQTAIGYTKSANQGLRASKAKYVILLNSDTIVTRKWANSLIECANSDSKIGMAGPLSNAASWQSIPERFDNKGNWAINEIPKGIGIDELASIVKQQSIGSYPKVKLLNGFCTLIKQEVFQKIGYLDEILFPKGYGEENDYCLRAVDAGFKLAIDDTTYIFHAKSKSFGDAVRKKLAKAGGEVLNEKYGSIRIDSAVEELMENKELKEIRKRVSQILSRHKLQSLKSEPGKFNVLFLLPIAGTAGGIHSIVQEVMGMRKLNVNAKMATWRDFKENYFNMYSNIQDVEKLFFFFDSYEELYLYCKNVNVVVATIHSSILILKEIYELNPHIVPAYYIQDYEPFFFEKESEDWKLAFDSYTLIKDCLLFAKTNWLREVIKELHGVEVEKVSPSLDHDLYNPTFTEKSADDAIGIVAMVRPSTPRRGAERTMGVLKRVKDNFGEKVQIDIFGTTTKNFSSYDMETNFDYTNYEVLKREEVSKLLKSNDVFIDLSLYQAFGRTGIEAMACGCAVVLPKRGGANEYAIENVNALLVDTGSDEDCYAAIEKLVSDKDLLSEMQTEGIRKASEYSIQRASISELLLFKQYEKQKKETHSIKNSVKDIDQPLKRNDFLNNSLKGKISYSLASVIVIYNSDSFYDPKFIMDLESSLRRGDEVITVLSNENQKYNEQIKKDLKDKPCFKIIEMSYALNNSALMNVGINQSSNPFVILLDPSAITPDNFITTLLKHFDDRRVGAVVPLIEEKDFQQGIEYHQILKSLYCKDFNSVNKYLLKENLNKHYKIRLASFHCLVLRKTIFKRIGLIDENLNSAAMWYDYSFRIRANGFIIKLSLDTFVGGLPNKLKTKKSLEENDYLFRKLETQYGVEKVPSPEELWGINEFNISTGIFNNQTTFSDMKLLNEIQSTEVSIIILSYNQFNYTKECVESIIFTTSNNFELIIVDNYSNNKTIEYLTELTRSNNNIKLILNMENFGFPKGINQGIQSAKGKYILIANNDIVVTEGWLERLIEVAESDSRIGIVGPISNEVSGAQKDKEATYKIIDEMHLYAASAKEKNKNKVMQFPRVAFLCTLIKREVIEKIGGLDERFSPGNYEDDDFCLRAQLAGYKTVIAQDVFIHHYGSKSFKADGEKKYAERLQINHKIFVNKWGADPDEIWLKRKPFNHSTSLFISINNDEFVKRFERAQKNIEDREFDLALNELELAIVQFESSEKAYSIISNEDLFILTANISLIVKDLKKAKTYFEEALKLNPSSSETCFGLGQVFYQAEMFEQSKSMLEWAIKNNPENTNAVKALKYVNEVLSLPQNHNSLLEIEIDSVVAEN